MQAHLLTIITGHICQPNNIRGDYLHAPEPINELDKTVSIQRSTTKIERKRRWRWWFVAADSWACQWWIGIVWMEGGWGMRHAACVWQRSIFQRVLCCFCEFFEYLLLILSEIFEKYFFFNFLHTKITFFLFLRTFLILNLKTINLLPTSYAAHGAVSSTASWKCHDCYCCRLFDCFQVCLEYQRN